MPDVSLNTEGTLVPAADPQDIPQVTEVEPTPSHSIHHHQTCRQAHRKIANGYEGRLDSLEGAVSYWVDAMGQSVDAARKRKDDRDHKKRMAKHLAGQISKTFKPKKRKTSFIG
ncbi:hypothetical protein GCM10009069_21920 [Algimonas arctica]|uniref:Uncharacterized protein n=1 Tax=Algimonas arctica TaxID=1479486 RepID=A0A8J3CRI6_9PROT|nr:hypothetical protein [Algimonas arctica]GHA98613.1 hypothetical protein GCM10009069_21920 [Algimonas arctica]